MTGGEREARDVHVVGLGAQTSLGRTALSSSAALRGGIHRQGAHPSLADREGHPISVSAAPYLAADLGLVDRLAALAFLAIDEALAPLHRPLDRPQPLPLILGLPAPRQGGSDFEERLRARLDRCFEERGVFSNIQTVPAGSSAGSLAIERAWRAVSGGEHVLCLAGSVDSLLDPAAIRRLDDEGRLRSRYNRHGLRPGEGAGFCLLSSVTRSRGLRSLGRVAAVATARPRGSGEPESDGGGALAEAWGQVLASLPEGRKVTGLIGDLNGEPRRQGGLGPAFERCFDRLEPGFSFLAPAESWGDVGAASGPLFLALALTSGGRGGAARSLIWTTGEEGDRSAALILGEG